MSLIVNSSEYDEEKNTIRITLSGPPEEIDRISKMQMRHAAYALPDGTAVLGHSVGQCEVTDAEPYEVTGYRAEYTTHEHAGVTYYVFRPWFLALNPTNRRDCGWGARKHFKFWITSKKPLKNSELLQELKDHLEPMLGRLFTAQKRAQRIRMELCERLITPQNLLRSLLKVLRFKDEMSHPEWMAAIACSAGNEATSGMVAALNDQGRLEDLLKYIEARREIGVPPTPTQRLKDRAFWLFHHWPRLIEEGANAAQAFDQYAGFVGYQNAGDLGSFTRWMSRLGVRLTAPGRPRIK